MNHAMNLALDAVNTILAARGMSPFDEEQVACLNDPARHTEAWNMLDRIDQLLGGELRPLFRAMAMRFGDALYVREFPSYGQLGFDIPEGFVDESYHNDVCPSFVGKGYILWANWASREDREFDVDRYALCVVYPEGEQDFVMGSENIDEVLRFIAATEKYSAEQRVFIGGRVTRIKAEVLNAVGYGTPFYDGGKTVPFNITSFGDLHDYCDANELGGLCEDDVVTVGNQLFPARDDEDTVRTQGHMDACEVIQDTINNWIASGTMRVAALAMTSYTTTDKKESEYA